MATDRGTYTVRDPAAPRFGPREFTAASVTELQSAVAQVFRRPGYLSYSRPDGVCVVITPSTELEDLPPDLVWTHLGFFYWAVTLLKVLTSAVLALPPAIRWPFSVCQNLFINVSSVLVRWTRRPGNPTLMEVLEEVPPECRCTATIGTSPTPKTILPEGFKLKRWQGFRAQVMGDINQLRPQLQSMRMLRGESDEPLPGASEDRTNGAFSLHVMAPVNRVLTALGYKVAFGPGRTGRFSKKPDFGLYVRDTDELSAGGEGKTATVLQNIPDLVMAFNGGPGKIRDKIVPQLYAYSWEQDRSYTWLTTYDQVWVTKMLDECTMLVSPPVDRTSRNPSVRQVMFWLAREAQGPGGKLPPGSSQVPASGQAGQGTQGGGAGPPSSGGHAYNTRSRSRSRAPCAPAPAPPGSSSQIITPTEAFGPLTDLGYGESGTVSAGRLNGRDVALKFADCFNSQDIVGRLQHEAEVYGKLVHLQGKYIPFLEGHGLTAYGTSYFLATRLIKGSHLKEGSVVSPVQRHAAEQALTAIHKAGFLHGDVRRDNLIFEEATGKAVFLDLGFSQACTRAEEHEAEMQELRRMLNPSPISVHAWPRS